MTVETSEMLKYLLWIVLAIAILVLIKWACNKSDKLVEGLKSKSSDEDDEDANEKKINKIKKKLANKAAELQDVLGKIPREDQEDILEKMGENARLSLRAQLMSGDSNEWSLYLSNETYKFIEETLPAIMNELDETSSVDKTVGGFF